MTDSTDNTAVTGPQTGYKSPPVKNRFQKGRSGNPSGRPKESRNLSTVLAEVLNQPVTLRQGGKSSQVSKGDAVIGVLMNMASKGERQAVDAVINVLGKIERLVEQPEAERKDVGVMVVPGVCKSDEEFKEVLAQHRVRRELNELRKIAEAPEFERKEASLRNIILLNKGTPEADAAAAELAHLTSSMEYLSNFYIKREHGSRKPVEIATSQLPRGSHPVYRRINSPVWSSVPWSDLPPDDPRITGRLTEGITGY